MYDPGRNESDERRRLALHAALAGGLGGAGLGALQKVFEGVKRAGPIGKAAAIGGGVMGGLAGGANYLGNLLMGTPDENDLGSPYTTRGTVGGGIGGGLAGAGLGALSASDKIRALAGKAGLASKVPDNLIVDAFKAAGRGGGRAGLLKAALLGGGLGALAGGYTGGDEGMALDVLADEMSDDMKMRRRRAAMEMLASESA